jgi:Rieske Fe-S protein
MVNEISRRAFLDRTMSLGVVGLAAAGLCVCMLTGCLKKDTTTDIPAKALVIKPDRVVVDVRQVKVLQKVGGSAKIVHPKLKERIIIVHPSDVHYLALSGLCTHRGKPVVYHHQARELRCINFGHSRFGMDGAPIKGPAKRSLKVYRTLYLGGKLEVFL